MFSGTIEMQERQELQDPSMIFLNSNIRIGIYGVSGAGKTSLLNEMAPILGNKCKIIEGSKLIASLAEGGLVGFLANTEEQFAIKSPKCIIGHYYLYSNQKFDDKIP